MRPARRRLAFFSAAIASLAAVLAVVLPAGIASAASRSAAGNRVWAISLAALSGIRADRLVSAGERLGEVSSCPFDASGACAAPDAASAASNVTRVGRWMGQPEFNQMSSTGRVVEGAGGRTYVISPPDPAAYPSRAAAAGNAARDVHCLGVCEMNLIESLLMRVNSLASWLSVRDITLKSGSSRDDVLRRSAWVNVSRGDREAELLLWESGEAEFSSSDPKGGITQEHYEIESVSGLGLVLGRLLGSID